MKRVPDERCAQQEQLSNGKNAVPCGGWWTIEEIENDSRCEQKKSKNDKTGEGGGKKRRSSQRENGMCWRWSLNWILRKTRVIVQSWCQLSFGVSRFVIQHYASKFVRMLRWIWFNQNTILSMPSPLHLISVFALSFNWLPLFFFSVCLSLSVKINSVCLARQHADTNGTQARKKAHLRL